MTVSVEALGEKGGKQHGEGGRHGGEREQRLPERQHIHGTVDALEIPPFEVDPEEEADPKKDRW
ncbi:MAG: hypothetical protein M5R36_23090 [Deltaproteobacteria bacterium]|nr:hypothetical protein [Deltaproteobacteria bacterium]